MQINHGIVAIPKFDDKTVFDCGKITVLHFVGYEVLPTIEDWVVLYDELQNDPDLGLVEEDFILVPATQEMIDFYLDKINVEDIEEE